MFHHICSYSQNDCSRCALSSMLCPSVLQRPCTSSQSNLCAISEHYGYTASNATVRVSPLIFRFCCCVQLRSSRFIDAERLLKVVPHNSWLEVQALLHKHLGDHREALRSLNCPFIVVLSGQLSSASAVRLVELHLTSGSTFICCCYITLNPLKAVRCPLNVQLFGGLVHHDQHGIV